MLILFDIDGTLFRGCGAGRLAFTRAMNQLFGPDTIDPEIDFSGRLDPWIMGQVLAANNIPITPELAIRFRDACHHQLRAILKAREFDVCALPGAIALVEALTRQSAVTLGLLTGNWEQNGWLKIESVGFKREPFTVNAWGDDGPTRSDLVPIAHSRYNGAEIDRAALPGRTIIIGDTIHDIRCAKTHGCLSLGVLTGGHTNEQLLQESPDRIVDDLSRTSDLCDWIMSFNVPAA